MNNYVWSEYLILVLMYAWYFRFSLSIVRSDQGRSRNLFSTKNVNTIFHVTLVFDDSNSFSVHKRFKQPTLQGLIHACYVAHNMHVQIQEETQLSQPNHNHKLIQLNCS